MIKFRFIFNLILRQFGDFVSIKLFAVWLKPRKLFAFLCSLGHLLMSSHSASGIDPHKSKNVNGRRIETSLANVFVFVFACKTWPSFDVRYINVQLKRYENFPDHWIRQ